MTKVARDFDRQGFVQSRSLTGTGFTHDILLGGMSFAYDLLDGIDEQLGRSGVGRLAQLIELANLSAVIGNFLRTGVSRASGGAFEANGPHKYPDLLARRPGLRDTEIKVALETNNPKGHLIKPGPHLTFRYVLGAGDGSYVLDQRGDVPWIWEIRFGVLEPGHFNVSNTEGDSGKTAVINQKGMAALQVVYCDLQRCPHSPRSPTYRALSELRRGKDVGEVSK